MMDVETEYNASELKGVSEKHMFCIHFGYSVSIGVTIRI
jgi:hypothetical protein